MIKKIFILILFTMASCGYQPLYKVNKEIDSLKVNEVELTGNERIGSQIYDNIQYILIEDDKSLNKLVIETQKTTTEVSKNSKGQVTSYRTILLVELKILDSDNTQIEKKTLQKEFSYDNDENKFKFKKYQNKIEKNLINDIVEDIIIYLNYS